MSSYQVAILEQVYARIAAEVAELHPAHSARYEAIRVPSRLAPVLSTTDECVYIVAEYQGKVLYYSYIDAGWAVDTPDVTGGVSEHAGELFRLGQIMNRLFGMPNIRTCGRGGGN